MVASDIPAHRDILKRTGGAIALVPLDASPAALAVALQAAHRQPTAVNQSIPTWDQVAEETLAVYYDLVSTGAAGGLTVTERQETPGAGTAATRASSSTSGPIPTG